MATITVPGMFLTGTHSARPAASAVGKGALYSCTTHKLVYQSDGSSWATWLGSPSGEIDYVAITSDVTISADTEAGSTTIVTGSAITYDGSTNIVIEFQAADAITHAHAGDYIVFTLFDGSSSIGYFGVIQTPAAAAMNAPIRLARRLTPSAATHTYSVRGFSPTSHGGTVKAGAGGTAARVPAFIRITLA